MAIFGRSFLMTSLPEHDSTTELTRCVCVCVCVCVCSGAADKRRASSIFFHFVSVFIILINQIKSEDVWEIGVGPQGALFTFSSFCLSFFLKSVSFNSIAVLISSKSTSNRSFATTTFHKFNQRWQKNK